MWSIKKEKLAKISGTYLKLVDPKITPKVTLTYPMKYMAQILSGVPTDIASHKNSSAE